MRAKSRAAGFTLLEIMIALAIIGTVLAAVLHSVNHHADVSYKNTITTQMYMLAKEQITVMELNPENSEGTFTGTDLKYKNIVKNIDDTDIIELRTTVSGNGKEVTLMELVVRQKMQER